MANCQYEKLDDQLYLMRIGDRLVYTTIKEIPIETVCAEKNRRIRNLTERGIISLDSNCKLSSPYFTMNPPKQLRVSRIQSNNMGMNLESSDLHIINITDRMDPLRLHQKHNKFSFSGLRLPLRNLLKEIVLFLTLFVATTVMVLSCIILRGCPRSQNVETSL